MRTGDLIKKRKLRFASILLTAVMLFTQTEEVMAMESVIAEDIGESIAVAEEESQAQLEEAIIETLKEKYSDQVPADNAAELTVTYLTDGGQLKSDAQALLEASGAVGVSIDDRNRVIQTADTEAFLAPLVYEKAGFTIDPQRAWKTEHYEIVGTEKEYSAGVVVGEKPIYGYKTYYFPADAKISALTGYAEGSKISLTPVWVLPNIKYDVNDAGFFCPNKDFLETEDPILTDNPNKDKIYYSKGETVKLLPITEEVPGYTFDGWEYEFEGDKTRYPRPGDENKEDKDRDEYFNAEDGYYYLKTFDKTATMTVYARWKEETYGITYLGLEVKPEPEEALAALGLSKDADIEDYMEALGASETSADTGLIGENASEDSVPDIVEVDGALMEVVDVINLGDEDAAPALQEEYSYHAPYTLPTAEEMNKGQLRPEFSEYNRFLCWSGSRKFNKTVTKLGMGGEIESGNVTLYAIYTARYPIPETEVDESVTDRSLKAVQNTVPNLLNLDDYAVVSLVGNEVSADIPEIKSVTLDEASSKYFELCEVDARFAGLGHGYAAVGIRLKAGIDADTVVKITKDAKLRKLMLKVCSVSPEKDSNGDIIYSDVPVTLKTSYKLPKYKLAQKSGTIYTAFLQKNSLGEVKPAEFRVAEKTGGLGLESFCGEWEADFVTGKAKTYTPVDPGKISVKVCFDDSFTGFDIIASDAAKGAIRLRNTGWPEKVYVYLPYTIKKSDKSPAIRLSAKAVTLNNTQNKESSLVRVSLTTEMQADPSLIELDSSKLPEGIKAELVPGTDTVRITGADALAKGTYKLGVKYQGVKKAATLKIKVVDTPMNKAIKVKVKGGIDALAGGNLFLTPKLNGYGGSISSVEVVSQDKDHPEFRSEWNGTQAELYSTIYYVPQKGKKEIALKFTLTTGVEIPCTIKVKTSVGKMSLDVYDSVISVKQDEAVPVPEGEGEPGLEEGEDKVVAQLPVIVTYTYKYFRDPGTKINRIHTIDLTRASGRSFIDIDPSGISKSGTVTGEYKNGVITYTFDRAAAVAGTYKLSIGGKWKLTNKKLTGKYTLTVK